MAYQAKPGTFSLFKNDKKGNENWPDYKGDGADHAGNAIEVAAWLKEGKNGKYMSCSFKAKGDVPKKRNEPISEEGEDSIPF